MLHVFFSKVIHKVGKAIESQNLSDPRIEELSESCHVPEIISLLVFVCLFRDPPTSCDRHGGTSCRCPFLLMLFYSLCVARAPLGGRSEVVGSSSTRRRMQPALRGRRASRQVISTYGNTRYPSVASASRSGLTSILDQAKLRM